MGTPPSNGVVTIVARPIARLWHESTLPSPVVDGVQRRFLACLTAFAALAAVAQGVSGMSELVLYLTPLFLIVALLLCGRYVAEERIVRRWRGRTPQRRPRRVRGRWQAVAEKTPVSLLERSPRLERGPPAPAAA
jgi:hypothetical protein